MDYQFLENLKTQWMAMIDSVADPLVIVDAHYKILRQNQAYWNLAHNAEKKPIQGFANQPCYLLFAGRDSPCTHCHLKTAVEKNKSHTWDTSQLFADKEFEIRVSVVESSKQDTLYVVHYRDVTERKRIQQHFAQAEKLASLGRMASGVAHELNSPLAGILAFAQILLHETPHDAAIREDLQQIEDGAKKCKTIVEDLLRLSRQDEPLKEQAKQVDIVSLTRSVLKFIDPILKKHRIQVVDGLPDEPLYIKAIPTKIEQVLLNLMMNAQYAMRKQGGSLEINCEVSLESPKKNPMVSLTIGDDGDGIPSNILHKIFEPFFTTKPVGEGTGLGLSICYSIMRQHQGDLKVQSEEGAGTVFTLDLPIW